MILDKAEKPAKPLYTPCPVCRRDTYHLLGNCTWHSEWRPPSATQATEQDKRDLLLAKLGKEKRLAKERQRKAKQEVLDKKERWLRTKGGLKGRKVYRKRIPLPPGSILCDRCWHPMERVLSSYGKLSAGLSSSRVVEEETYLTQEGKVLTVETLGKRMFPTYSKVCICPSCVEALNEYVLREQQTWFDDPSDEKGEFKPSWQPEIKVTDEGRMPPGFGLDRPPSNLRSGKWKKWNKI